MGELHAAALDDRALVERLRAGGDTQAEGELYRRFGPRVRLFGLRHTGDAATADDVVQDVMQTVLVKARAGAIEQPERLASFVLGTARRTAQNLRRGEARRRRILAHYADPREATCNPLSYVGDAERLQGCLMRLAERERTVLILSFYAERDAGEIARELALTASHVRVIRHRAVAALQTCMEGSS